MSAEAHDAQSDAAEMDAVERGLDERVRHEMERATQAIASLSQELSTSLAPSTVYGRRLALVLSRRLQEVEGAVAVAMALADRTGVELRGELQSVAQRLAEQLESVAEMARAAPGKPASAHDLHALEARFDEVHRRIDALTRELHVVSRGAQETMLGSPYAERLADTLGRRLESVEGAVAVASALAERVDVDTRQELEVVAADAQRRADDVLQALSGLAERLEQLEGDHDGAGVAGVAEAIRKELRAFESHVGEELATLANAARAGADVERAAEVRLRELAGRLDLVERDRDVMNARLVRAQESWAAERVALQERVAELAARIVTGPVPGPADGEDADWPTARAFDQLRIAVEGVRMRLAYHEKAVAELSDARGVDERLISMHQLLGRLESAEQSVRGERDSVQDQLERIASRIDWRLQQLETSAPGVEA